MATIERYEDIQGWQRARELANFSYAVTKQKAFARDYGLKDQIRRAAVSIMSNIAEGFERGGRAEFIQFPSIGKSSAGEVQSQLYVALDQEYIAPEQFDKGYRLCDEAMRLIGGFIAYLRKSPIKGTKFKTRNSKPKTLRGYLKIHQALSLRGALRQAQDELRDEAIPFRGGDCFAALAMTLQRYKQRPSLPFFRHALSPNGEV